MEYSALQPVSRGLASASPTTPHVAVASGNVLDIHDVDTLALLSSTTTAGPITSVAWGQHATHGLIIAAASTPPNTIAIVAVPSGTVLVDVHESALTPIALSLSPFATHLLVQAELSLPATLLAVSPPHHHLSIPFPANLHDWSPTTPHLAIVTRRASTSVLHIVALPSLKTVAAVPTAPAVAAPAGILWTRAGLLLWGRASANAPSLALFSATGQVLLRGLPLTPSCGPSTAGLRVLALNPACTLAAIGAQDALLRLVNVSTWRVVSAFAHDSPPADATFPPVVFREARNGEDAARFLVAACAAGQRVEVSTRAATMPKRGPGVVGATFSACGRLLASRGGAPGNVVFVWSVERARLVGVLVLQRLVTCMRWSRGVGRGGAQLAIVSGGEHVYIWRECGAAAVRVRAVHPWRAPLRAAKVDWSCDDHGLVVVDGVSAKAFLVVYVT